MGSLPVTAFLLPALVVGVTSCKKTDVPAPTRAPVVDVPSARGTLPDASDASATATSGARFHAVAVRRGGIALLSTREGATFVTGDTYVARVGSDPTHPIDRSGFFVGLPGTTMLFNDNRHATTMLDGKWGDSTWLVQRRAREGLLDETSVYRLAGAQWKQVPNREGVVQWRYEAVEPWTNDRWIALRIWEEAPPANGGWGPMSPEWETYRARARAEIAKRGTWRLEVVVGPKETADLPELVWPTRPTAFRAFATGHAWALVEDNDPTVARSRIFVWSPGSRKAIRANPGIEGALGASFEASDRAFVWSLDMAGAPIARFEGGEWTKIEAPDARLVRSVRSARDGTLYAITGKERGPRGYDAGGAIFRKRLGGAWEGIPLPSVKPPPRSGRGFRVVPAADGEPILRPASPAESPTEALTMNAIDVAVQPDDTVWISARAGAGDERETWHTLYGSRPSETVVELPSNDELSLVQAEAMPWREESLARLDTCNMQHRPPLFVFGASTELGDLGRWAKDLRADDAATMALELLAFAFYEVTVEGRPSLVGFVNPTVGVEKPPSSKRVSAFLAAVKKRRPGLAPKLYCRWFTPTRAL